MKRNVSANGTGTPSKGHNGANEAPLIWTFDGPIRNLPLRHRRHISPRPPPCPLPGRRRLRRIAVQIDHVAAGAEAAQSSAEKRSSREGRFYVDRLTRPALRSARRPRVRHLKRRATGDNGHRAERAEDNTWQSRARARPQGDIGLLHARRPRPSATPRALAPPSTPPRLVLRVKARPSYRAAAGPNSLPRARSILATLRHARSPRSARGWSSSSRGQRPHAPSPLPERRPVIC
jgi:hypothetical protein